MEGDKVFVKFDIGLLVKEKARARSTKLHGLIRHLFINRTWFKLENRLSYKKKVELLAVDATKILVC